MARNTLSRAMNDVGLAAWFGGTLANTVALNQAGHEAGHAKDTADVINAGWDRWTPLNAAAIGVHLAGSTGLLIGNMPRMRAQRGVAATAAAKTSLMAAALGATAYSRMLGKKVSKIDDVPVDSAADPESSMSPDVAKAQRQLSMLQWAVPALTGAMLVVDAFAGEQQRASEVHRGFMKRLGERVSTLRR